VLNVGGCEVVDVTVEAVGIMLGSDEAGQFSESEIKFENRLRRSRLKRGGKWLFSVEIFVQRALAFDLSEWVLKHAPSSGLKTITGAHIILTVSAHNPISRESTGSVSLRVSAEKDSEGRFQIYTMRRPMLGEDESWI